MHTLPRFSVDCDIVIKDKKELKKIKEVLKKIGYQKIEESKKSTPYHGTFVRYEKEIEKGFKVSMDIFIEKVLDRQTGAVLDAKWIFENAIDQDLKGKTFQEKLKAKVTTRDALIIMKLLSCRETDIRDIFMILPGVTDLSFIKNEINKRTNFEKQYDKLKNKVLSKDFKDNLQGVFGFLPEATFEKHKESVLKLLK